MKVTRMLQTFGKRTCLYCRAITVRPQKLALNQSSEPPVQLNNKANPIGELQLSRACCGTSCSPSSSTSKACSARLPASASSSLSALVSLTALQQLLPTPATCPTVVRASAVTSCLLLHPVSLREPVAKQADEDCQDLQRVCPANRSQTHWKPSAQEHRLSKIPTRKHWVTSSSPVRGNPTKACTRLH